MDVLWLGLGVGNLLGPPGDDLDVPDTQCMAQNLCPSYFKRYQSVRSKYPRLQLRIITSFENTSTVNKNSIPGQKRIQSRPYSDS